MRKDDQSTERLPGRPASPPSDAAELDARPRRTSGPGTGTGGTANAAATKRPAATRTPAKPTSAKPAAAKKPTRTAAPAPRAAAVTRGGHIPTGTSASRRAKSSVGATDKGERTRALLLAAARRVFERVGYVDCRVTDIVKEAGLSHGAFYTYFPSKQEVFQQVSGQVGEMIDQAIGHAPEDQPGETFENLLRANARYLDVYRANARIIMVGDQVNMTDPVLRERRLQNRRRHVNRVARMIVRLQERGIARRDVDPRATGSALVAMLASSAYWAEVDPVDYDPENQAVALTMIFAHAIGIPVPSSADADRVMARHRERRRAADADTD